MDYQLFVGVGGGIGNSLCDLICNTMKHASSLVFSKCSRSGNRFRCLFPFADMQVSLTMLSLLPVATPLALSVVVLLIVIRGILHAVGCTSALISPK